MDVVCSNVVSDPAGNVQRKSAIFYVRFPAALAQIVEVIWRPKINGGTILNCPIETSLLFGRGKEPKGSSCSDPRWTSTVWGSEVVSRPIESRSRDMIFEPKGTAAQHMNKDARNFAERMVDREQMRALGGIRLCQALDDGAGQDPSNRA